MTAVSNKASDILSVGSQKSVTSVATFPTVEEIYALMYHDEWLIKYYQDLPIIWSRFYLWLITWSLEL